LAGTLFAFLSYRMKHLNVIHLSSLGSYGTLFYPVGMLTAFLVLSDLPIDYFRVSVLLLSVSDTVTSFGTFLRRGNPRLALPAEEKSLWGSAGFAAATLLISQRLLPHPVGNDISYLAVLAVVAVNLEIFSFRGSDNLSIPLECLTLPPDDNRRTDSTGGHHRYHRIRGHRLDAGIPTWFPN
ncbi:MAG: hypothetical protein P1P77_17755, partial [Spirochaetaceae bacterium]|nr:hypothetical protein [Spirochaetaceae bacterium]